MLLEAATPPTTPTRRRTTGRSATLPRYLANGQINPAWLAQAAAPTPRRISIRDCAFSFGCTAWMSNGRISVSKTPAWCWWIGHVLCHRHSQHQGRVQPIRSDPVTFYRRPSSRSLEIYHQRPAEFRHGSDDARQHVRPLKYDLGYYVQDSWTIKRLTLNPGLRVDNFNSYIEATANPAGRFVPAASFHQRQNVPNWLNVSGAAPERGVRPVRRRQDRDQGQLQQVLPAADRRLRRTIRPALQTRAATGSTATSTPRARVLHARRCRPTATTSPRTTKSVPSSNPNFGLPGRSRFRSEHQVAG